MFLFCLFLLLFHAECPVGVGAAEEGAKGALVQPPPPLDLEFFLFMYFIASGLFAGFVK